jgi:hypothetical protein
VGSLVEVFARLYAAPGNTESDIFSRSEQIDVMNQNVVSVTFQEFCAAEPVSGVTP